jgi:hypothetical protein
VPLPSIWLLGRPEVHIGCILERLLESLHRRSRIRIHRFDVAFLCHANVRVSQDSLNRLVLYSKPIQVRRKSISAALALLNIDGPWPASLAG